MAEAERRLVAGEGTLQHTDGGRPVALRPVQESEVGLPREGRPDEPRPAAIDEAGRAVAFVLRPVGSTRRSGVLWSRMLWLVLGPCGRPVSCRAALSGLPWLGAGSSARAGMAAALFRAGPAAFWRRRLFRAGTTQLMSAGRPRSACSRCWSAPLPPAVRWCGLSSALLARVAGVVLNRAGQGGFQRLPMSWLSMWWVSGSVAWMWVVWVPRVRRTR